MLWLPPPRPLENVPAWQSPRSKEGRQWCQNCLHLAILVHSIPSVGTKDWRDAQLCRIISYLPGEEAKLASDADNTLLMQYFPPKYHVKILFSSLSKNCWFWCHCRKSEKIGQLLNLINIDVNKAAVCARELRSVLCTVLYCTMYSTVQYCTVQCTVQYISRLSNFWGNHICQQLPTGQNLEYIPIYGLFKRWFFFSCQFASNSTKIRLLW